MVCTDSGFPPLSLQTELSLTVINVNEAPTDISVSATSIQENMPAGTAIGILTTTDADSAGSNGAPQSTYTYSFATRDARPIACGADTACPFSVDPAGALRTTVALDYETQSVYNVTITSTDPTGLTISEPLVLSVVDVNDPPTAIFLSSAAVREEEVGAQVGQVSVLDEDAGQIHTLSLVDTARNDGGLFVLVGSTLRLRPTVAADYEFSGATLTITLRATDNGAPLSLSVEQDVNITVLPVNEAPTSVQVASVTGAVHRVNATFVTAPETLAAGTPIVALAVADPDNIGFGATRPQTHTCAVVPPPPGTRSTSAMFVVLPVRNTLALATGELNFETAVTEHVMVRCTFFCALIRSLFCILDVCITHVH